MKQIFLAFIVLFACAFSTMTSWANKAAPAANPKSKKVEKLIELMGGHKNAKEVINQNMEIFKAIVPNVDAKVWTELGKELNQNVTELMQSLVPIYEKHLTDAEIDGLTTFYESPVGKAYAEKQIQIQKESMMIGASWGMKVQKKMVDKLKSKGYKIPEKLTN